MSHTTQVHVDTSSVTLDHTSQSYCASVREINKRKKNGFLHFAFP